VVLYRPRKQPVDIACCDVHAETAPEQRAGSQAWAPSRMRHCAVKQGRLRMRPGPLLALRPIAASNGRQNEEEFACWRTLECQASDSRL
jgi:hypothetical protein